MRHWLVALAALAVVAQAGNVAAQPDASVDAESAVGAIPVPDAEEPEEWDWQLGELDKHVTPDELPRGGRWRRQVRIQRGGHVLVRLMTDGAIDLHMIDAQDAVYRRFVIGRHAAGNHLGEPKAFTWDGPILFAVRLPVGSRQVPRQFVVFTRRTSVFVASREVGATRWRRHLRLDFPEKTNFQAHPWYYPH